MAHSLLPVSTLLIVCFEVGVHGVGVLVVLVMSSFDLVQLSVTSLVFLDKTDT